MPIYIQYKELLFIPISIFFCVKKIIATNYFLLLKILNKTPWWWMVSHYMKYKKSYDFSRVLQIYQLFTYIFEISKD